MDTCLNRSILDGITSGPFWPLKCMLVNLVAVLLFTCAPAVLVRDRDMRLPPAYALKAEHPLADTGQVTVAGQPGEQSHGAKLTPRLVGSLTLWAARKAAWHPYFPATLFGIVFLLSGVLVAYRITGDRAVGLFAGLLFSGLYATSACFSVNYVPKPFDGVAIGLLGATLMAIPKTGLLGAAAFLCCWTDERGVLSLAFVALVIAVWPGMDRHARRRRCGALVVAAAAYGISRVIMARALGWAAPDAGMVGISLPLGASFAQLAAWSAFEGGWLVIGWALWLLIQRQAYGRLAFAMASLAVAVAASLQVLDASRSAAFAFPLILAALAVLKDADVDGSELRRVTALSAAITLLAPNLEVIIGSPVRWLPPYVPYLLLE